MVFLCDNPKCTGMFDLPIAEGDKVDCPFCGLVFQPIPSDYNLAHRFWLIGLLVVFVILAFLL